MTLAIGNYFGGTELYEASSILSIRVFGKGALGARNRLYRDLVLRGP